MKAGAGSNWVIILCFNCLGVDRMTLILFVSHRDPVTRHMSRMLRSIWEVHVGTTTRDMNKTLQYILALTRYSWRTIWLHM